MGKRNLTAEEKKARRKQRTEEKRNSSNNDTINVLERLDRKFTELNITNQEFRTYFFDLVEYILDYFLEELYDVDTFFNECNKNLEPVIIFAVNQKNKEQKEFLTELSMAITQRVKLMHRNLIVESDNPRADMLANSILLENDLEKICIEHSFKRDGVNPDKFI